VNGTAATSERARRAVANVIPRSATIHGAGSELTVNGVSIDVAWVGEGWLRDVRSLLGRHEKGPDVLVARRMSPGAREAITKAGLSWVDETGAAEIVLDSIVVSRPGQPTEPSAEWTASVLAVAEALLCGGRGTVKAMKAVTDLSTGSCTNALRMLGNAGLLESAAARGRGSARQVIDLDNLLDAYAAEVARESSSPRLRLGVTWREPHDRLVEIGSKWDAAGIAWACTGVVAASVLAPHLTSGGSAEAYVDAGTVADLESVATDAGLAPIAGGRLTIRPFPTASTRRLATLVAELRVAPWPRVYADLRTIGVRGEEAAEHLRQVMHAE